MSLFKEIRERVSAHDAAEKYGLPFRGKRARCPWHDDRHPDLAFYQDGTCYCHACHHGGDAAALTARIFGLSMLEAARKLNVDFGLGLDTGKPLPQAEKNRIEQLREARRQELDRHRREWTLLCAVRREADQRMETIEKNAADPDRLWDDPAFQAALLRRARADSELDRISRQ